MFAAVAAAVSRIHGGKVVLVGVMVFVFVVVVVVVVVIVVVEK
jgi:hypothetical protein